MIQIAPSFPIVLKNDRLYRCSLVTVAIDPCKRIIILLLAQSNSASINPANLRKIKKGGGAVIIENRWTSLCNASMQKYHANSYTDYTEDRRIEIRRGRL